VIPNLGLTAPKTKSRNFNLDVITERSRCSDWIPGHPEIESLRLIAVTVAQLNLYYPGEAAECPRQAVSFAFIRDVYKDRQ
jgi:hypothetical protein